jgi:ribosomal-protein-alanine N-acetyltransferase
MNFSLVLQSERLFLEPISLKHATETYVNWLNDPAVFENLDTRGGQTTDTLIEFINLQINNKAYMWAIIDKTTNIHIGNIKVDPVNFVHKFGEYGILIGNREYWGKGYAKEASEVVLKFFFQCDNYLRKINLGVVENNKNAISLYKKLGFTQEGYLKRHLVYDGKEVDIIRMALFREDFLKKLI